MTEEMRRMTDMMESLKDAAPTVAITAAIGACAAIFMERPSKKALTYGLVGAGVGAFAHVVFGLDLGLGGKKDHLVGVTAIERGRGGARAIPAYQHGAASYRSRGDFQTGQGMIHPGMRGLGYRGAAARMGGTRARGDFDVIAAPVYPIYDAPPTHATPPPTASPAAHDRHQQQMTVMSATTPKTHAAPAPPPAHGAPPPPPPVAHAAPPPPPQPVAHAAPPPPPPPAKHATTGYYGWYTPGWQQHFPPTAYESNHYGPMEYWWAQ